MRIASLSPAVTEILTAFEIQDRIVCESPQQLHAHEAELVFTSTPIQKQLSEQLTAQGCSVVHYDPRTINQIYESVRLLGMMLQCEPKAEEVVLVMQQGFKDIKRKAGLLPRRLRVYIEESHDPPLASGNWVPEVAHIAGVTQYPVAIGEPSAKVTPEQVAAFDPDMVVIGWSGAGLQVDKELLTQRVGWETLRAVQAGNVRVIDDSFLNRPTPSLVEGARRLYGWAFETLH